MAQYLQYIINMNRLKLLFIILFLINLALAQWVIKRPMPHARYGAMAAVVNDRVYIIGGLINSNTAVNYVEEYNPVLDTWIPRAPMPTPRGLGVCGVVNNKIFVVGGVSARNMPVETVEVYDPQTNQWQRKRRLPSRRTGYNGGVIADSIYVCGGYLSNISTYTDMVEVYCVSQDSWFNRQSLNQARVDFGATVYRNHLYAISGLFFNYLNQVEEYSPLLDSWQMRAPIPFGRLGTACVGFQNRIYVIGGERHGPRNVYSRVDIFNIDNNSWFLGESINVARSYACAVEVNNNIYVFGGLLRNGQPTPTVEQLTSSGIAEIGYENINNLLVKVLPNPFSFYTTIYYNLSSYKIEQMGIYNITGNLIKRFSNAELMHRNSIIWDGRDKTNRRVKPGIYFLQITIDNQKRICQKVVVR